MIDMENLTLDDLIEKVVKNRVEVTLNIDPDHMDIHFEPWKPFEYACPFRPVEKMAENKNCAIMNNTAQTAKVPSINLRPEMSIQDN